MKESIRKRQKKYKKNKERLDKKTEEILKKEIVREHKKGIEKYPRKI